MTNEPKQVSGTDIYLYDQAIWDRNTVADGVWLQSETLDPISANDRILASAIHDVSADFDEMINYVSATVDANKIELHNEIYVASSYLQGEVDMLEAATDVVDIIGTLPELSTYSKRITENDIIKILDTEGIWTDPVTQTEHVFSGDQVYLRYTGETTATPDPTKWTYVGQMEPYYNKNEVNTIINDLSGTVDDRIDDLSATVSDNYLSANKNAVIAGKNIQIDYDQNNPKITINTKEDVDFTKLSADTAWVDTISANVSAFDFYETISDKRLSETQQGLLINTTDSPFDPAVSASEGDNFWPSNFEQIFSAWYDTDKLINIKYTNDNITRLYTLHNVRQYTEDDFTFYDLNFISNDDKVAYTAYAKVKRNGGEGGGAPSTPVLYACDEGPIDVEYTGEHGVYVSGDHKVGLSSTYETALKEGSAASAYITSHSGDFLNSAHNAYGILTFGNKSYPATNNNYNFKFIAGQGINFTTDNNQVTISAEGTTYQAGDYISTANKTISVIGNLITSAEAGSAASAWVNNNINKIAYTSSFNGSNNVITGYGASSFAGGISSVSAGGNINNPTEYTTNINLSAGGGVQFVTANNDVLGIKTSTMEYSPYDYSTYSDMTSFKINAVALQSSQQYESVVIVNDRVYGFLMPDPVSSDQLKIPVARYANGRGYYYLENVTAAIGNYVSAANQQHITVATATTLPNPIPDGIYYIV